MEKQSLLSNLSKQAKNRKNTLVYLTFLASFFLFGTTAIYADLFDADDIEDPKPKVQLKTKKNKEDKQRPKEKSTLKKAKTKTKAKRNKKPLGQDNSDLPVLFESEGLRGTKENGQIELQKNVVITQGDFRMDANEAKVLFDNKTEEVDRVIAKGNVKIFKVDPKTGVKVRAKGDLMTFRENKQTVEIEGNARFWRGKDLVRGKKIIYNLKTGWLNAKKVEGVISPGETK